MAKAPATKTKVDKTPKKRGPKGPRGTKIGPGAPKPSVSASITRAFLADQTDNQRTIINHLPRCQPDLGTIIKERFGRMPLIQDPTELMVIAQEYFEWCERNPLWEDKLVTFQGFATHEPVPKMRLRSIGTLCFFLGINPTTWYLWRRTRDDLKEAIAQIEERIAEENKAGASAELMNANFVARVMGLADRQEHTGANGGPLTTSHVDIDLSQLSEEELEAYRIAAEAIERVRASKLIK